MKRICIGLMLVAVACGDDEGGGVGAGEVIGLTDYGHLGIQLRYDGNGSLHAAWIDQISGDIWYASCDAACENGDAWAGGIVARTSLPDYDKYVDEGAVWLEVTDDGRPRLAYVFEGWYNAGETLDTSTFSYAECDINCDDPANWGAVDLYMNQTMSFSETIRNSRFFTLTDDGQPRMIVELATDWSYSGPELSHTDGIYLFCDTACAEAGGWSAVYGPRVHLAQYGYDGFHSTISLDLDSAGNPVYLMRDPDTNAFGDRLLLAECHSGCETENADWDVYPISRDAFGSDSFVLKVDDRDRYHVGFSGSTGDRVIAAYSRCDGDCDDIDNWSPNDLVEEAGVNRNMGYALDMTVTGNGAVHLTFFSDQDATTAMPEDNALVDHLWCTADDCTAEDAPWNLETITDVRDFNEYPEAPYGEYGNGGICVAFGWGMQGYPTSVAIGPGGAVAVGHTSNARWGCGADVGEYYDPNTDEWYTEWISDIFSYHRGFVVIGD